MSLIEQRDSPAFGGNRDGQDFTDPAITTHYRHGLPPLDDLVPRQIPEGWMFTRADEAAREACRRMGDDRLRAQVAAFLGPQALPLRGDRPAFVLVRAVESADTEMARLVRLCDAVGAQPIVVTMHRDRFINFNPDKFRRARPTFWSSRPVVTLRVGDLKDADGTPMDRLRTRRGGSLVDFHGRLFQSVHPDVPRWDRSEWLRPGGHSDYVHFFALAMVGAVLVEARDNDPREAPFWRERVEPAFTRANELFGARPLMTCHYSPGEIDDDYWWGHPLSTLPVAKSILGDPRA